ncbi:MAG TPA: hypothetical protein VEO55_10500 [Candidatus Dormibacteraeota bacterium]|nr:hypothetical protein [Candidatus Dormibacteraeota bacterium]
MAARAQRTDRWGCVCRSIYSIYKCRAGNFVMDHPEHLTVPAAQPPERPYLAFIRCGTQSLHRRLLSEDPHRLWDCCVSWYCPPVDEQLAEYYSSGGDNKLEGFLRFREEFGNFDRYRYVLLLDDDIYFQPGDISRFFSICDRHSILLAQPALRWDTHYILRVTMHNPACELRRVSFVEVMAPCFQTQTLAELLPTFDLNKSTWGVDGVWASMLQATARALYVVDAVQMEHTRPFDPSGGAFYRKLRALGVDPYAESRHLESTYPIRGGRRTLRQGHVYRHALPSFLNRTLLIFFESVKKLVQSAKQLRRTGRRATQSR